MAQFSTKVFRNSTVMFQATWLPNKSLLIGLQEHGANTGVGIVLSLIEAGVIARALLSRTFDKITRPDGRQLRITPDNQANPYREGMNISLLSENIFLEAREIRELVEMIQYNLN
jgi:hypothetical protein